MATGCGVCEKEDEPRRHPTALQAGPLDSGHCHCVDDQRITGVLLRHRFLNPRNLCPQLRHPVDREPPDHHKVSSQMKSSIVLLSTLCAIQSNAVNMSSRR